jgi:hypothetical protein
VPRNVAVALIILGLVAGGAWWGGTRGESVRLAHPQGNSSLGDARAFRQFPLYNAGTSVAGLRLEAVQRTERTSPSPHVEFSFHYGRCRLPADGGCGSPLVILIWPDCYRYETRFSIPARQRRVVRGVPARLLRGGTRLELYPAGSTIVVNSSAAVPESVLRIAGRLRGLNVGISPDDGLPSRPPYERGTRCGTP